MINVLSFWNDIDFGYGVPARLLKPDNIDPQTTSIILPVTEELRTLHNIDPP